VREGTIFPVVPTALDLPDGYAATLKEIKDHLRSARLRAVLAANPVVIEAYWQIGRIILARQQAAVWGANEHLHLVTLTWIPRSLVLQSLKHRTLSDTPTVVKNVEVR